MVVDGLILFHCESFSKSLLIVVSWVHKITAGIKNEPDDGTLSYTTETHCVRSLIGTCQNPGCSTRRELAPGATAAATGRMLFAANTSPHPQYPCCILSSGFSGVLPQLTTVNPTGAGDPSQTRAPTFRLPKALKRTCTSSVCLLERCS
jgi:hypothetical protein